MKNLKKVALCVGLGILYLAYLVVVKDVVNVDLSIWIDYPQLKAHSEEVSDEMVTGFPYFLASIYYSKKCTKNS